MQRPVPAKWPVRLLLIALVLAAVLVILLRMAEFTGHPVHRRSSPPRISAYQPPPRPVIAQTGALRLS